MIDITHKSSTLRTATAQAVVKVSSQETINAVQNRKVPKGDVYEMAKAAGLLAVKKTADIIPDCHPLPVEYAAVTYRIEGLEIYIEMKVKAIYKTGVEVEAMHGVSVVALTIYDMLKPMDKGIEIHTIKLIEKTGGKSDFSNLLNEKMKAAVIVCSDSIASGEKKDKAGKLIIEKLRSYNIDADDYTVIPDDEKQIQATAKRYCDKGLNMVIITGGTGLSPRDNTPKALAPLIEKEIPGIMEAARAYGQERTPYSMLSRGLAGMRKNTLLLAVPGSTKGAAETIDALFPAVLHIFKVQEYGFRH